MTGLRILITNNTLAARAGTELYVRDIAVALLRRGHRPVAFSMTLGEVAEELRSLTVPVIDDMRSLSSPPDVIHGHHHYETMMALLQFPDAPAVSFCHGWLPWQEAPPRFPRILRYVVPDETCRDRLIFENGIPLERVDLIGNFVDLGRFPPRGPLPASPRRALVFSNALNESNGVAVIREACARGGISVDVVGAASGHAAARPEGLLGDYDIVFAKARCALEALAVGAAVIVCDQPGMAGMVTTRNVEHWRRLNFGIRTLSQPISTELVWQEVARYDAADGGLVSQRIRRTAGLDDAVEELVRVYEEVVGEFEKCVRDRPAELMAASAYLREWGPRFKGEPVDMGEALRVYVSTLVGDPTERKAEAAERFEEGWRLVQDARQSAAHRVGEAHRLLQEARASRAEEEGRLGYQLLQRARRVASHLFPLGTARGKAYLGLLGLASRVVRHRNAVRT